MNASLFSWGLPISLQIDEEALKGRDKCKIKLQQLVVLSEEAVPKFL